MPSKTCIVVNGPTAVGKTELAIQLARYFQTEIISSDSRQCYRELRIGVAKPTHRQLAEIPHHFINSHSIHETVNAAVFEAYAMDRADNIFAGHDILVMAGGTGLYTRAFCEGLDSIPPIPEQLKAGILERYETGGMNWLQEELREQDPEYHRSGEMQNPRRMLRALEVKLATGQSILSFQGQRKTSRPFQILQIGLEANRELLYSRINQRVDVMVSEGLVEEAGALYPFRNLAALQTVGYREIFNWIEGKAGLEEAIIQIKTNTRHYAKRQLTWFKNQSEMSWFQVPFDSAEIIHHCVSFTHYAAK